jgi:cell volume regulation protein A
VRAGDRLHVLYREEASRRIVELSGAWRSADFGPAKRPPRQMRGASTVFSARPWTEADGDATRPERVGSLEVVDHLRLRRDAPGSLVVLEDGRYALCGSVLIVGARRQVIGWIERRLRDAGAEERAWLRTVLGAVATDAQESAR